MARKILLKPKGRITRLDYEEAFGMPYEEIWNPLSGSPLYDSPESQMRRWERLQQDIPDLKSILHKRIDTVELKVRRWALAQAIQGGGLLPGFWNPKLVLGAGFKLLAYCHDLSRVDIPTWKVGGTLRCGNPEIEWTEAMQGWLKDCTFIATVASLVRLDMFPKPEHTEDGKQVKVRVGTMDHIVDDKVRWDPLTHDPWDAHGRPCGDGIQETWPSFTEYAYCVSKGGQVDDLHKIEGLYPEETLHDLTGKTVTTLDGSAAIDWKSFVDDDGGFTRPAVAWTGISLEHRTLNISSFHSYSVVGALLDTLGRPTDLVLRNPSGRSDESDVALAGAFERLNNSAVWRGVLDKDDHGLIAVPIDKFWDWFEGISYV